MGVEAQMHMSQAQTQGHKRRHRVARKLDASVNQPIAIMSISPNGPGLSCCVECSLKVMTRLPAAPDLLVQTKALTHTPQTLCVWLLFGLVSTPMLVCRKVNTTVQGTDVIPVRGAGRMARPA